MTDDTINTEQLIEGGEITDVDNDEIKIDPLKKQKAETTKRLAILLVVILALSFGIHYAMISWLIIKGTTSSIDTLEKTFATWLPVISGLASSAVTYYFSKEK